MKKLKQLLLYLIIVTGNSFGQTIIDPVENSYFIIRRKSPSVILPIDFGGGSVKGFAGMKITLNSSGKLLNSELIKLKLSGAINLSYQMGREQKNDTIRHYEAFLKKCVSQIKIVKTDNRKPPKVNTITFLLRF